MFGFLLMALALPKAPTMGNSTPQPKVAVAVPAASSVGQVSPSARLPLQPVLPPPTTTTTLPPTTTTTPSTTLSSVTSSSVECVLTVDNGQGYSVTYSPGDADANGSCAAYPGSVPTTVSVTTGD